MLWPVFPLIPYDVILTQSLGDLAPIAILWSWILNMVSKYGLNEIAYMYFVVYTMSQIAQYLVHLDSPPKILAGDTGFDHTLYLKGAI